MELTVLNLSSIIYVLIMLFLLSSYPNLFVPNSDNQKKNREKCFISFFIAGILAIIVHQIVSRMAS
jgi:hypothetical protein